ncbi:hypothetical protein [Pararhizobium sp.]|uniref:hypothetical protein n=1 Tax=Pararhizobium sp. TaxID=1977563 RepID=UPI002716A1F9|nr:hypothetical protein [Pararhizobium sp.]MDO9416614.1 hypothetical protein [Pararhizobium sp.]
MQSIRSVIFTAAGIALAVAGFVFAASLGLALAGVLAVLMVGSSLAARFSPRPVHATVHGEARPSGRDMRVWNDGRGTIIDM